MTPTRHSPPAARTRRLPLLRGFLLLLTVLLTLPAAAWAQQNPSFSNTVFTPASGATLRVGDQVRVAVTVSNSPSGVRLFFGPTGGFASSLAAFFTSVGGDRYEAVYSVSSGALEIAQNGGGQLYFQIQADKGTSAYISTSTSTYTIVPAGGGGGQPDVTVALPEGQSLAVATVGSDVRLFAGLVISNRGTAPAGVFNGAVVLSPSQTYNPSTLLINPDNGGILRGNFAFAEFAKSAGRPAAELPANGSFDVFAGSLTLPLSTYTALLAQSSVPLYAFAVVDFDNGLPESNENNNAVLLGQLTPPTGGGTAPFTVDLKGIKDGGVVAPGTEVTLKARIRLPQGVTANVAKVEFFEDDELAATATESPYKFTRNFSRARTGALTAKATDDQGRSATSDPVRFRVAAGAAGPLALDTAVEPAGTTVTPGTVITYTFSVTNTGQTFAAANVAITAPVPDDTRYDGAEVLDNAGSREVAADKRSVTFRFNDIPAKETRRARLQVRLPFDARITGGSAKPITTDDVLVTGNGFGGVAVEGRFEPVGLTPTGPLPARAPRLALLKTIADRDGDSTDDLDIVEDPELGPIPAVGENGVLTLVLLASNYGEVAAQKVAIKDRLPDGFELVDGSARVNDTAAGALLKVNGSTIKFKLGNFQPGEAVGLTYQIRKLPRVQGDPVGRLVVESRGAEISSLSLRGTPDSIPEILPIRIVPKSIPLVLETYANPARPSVGGTQTYLVRYRNEGKVSKNARITATLPAGTTFRSATNGGALQGDGRTVVFSLGDVPREGRGEVSVDVNVTAAARADDNLRLRFSAAFSDNKFGPQSASQLAGTARARANGTPGPVTRVEGDDLLRSVVDDSFLFAADVPRLGILKYAPQSVPVGGTFSYLYVAVNHGTVVDRFVTVSINAPNGAVFDSFGGGAALTRNATGYTILFGDLKPQETRVIKITFRATAPAGTRIDEGRTVAGSPSVPFRQQSLTTLVVDGDAAASDNQIAILRAQLESIGLDATVALADPAIRARARLIGNDSGGFKVAGVDYLQLNNGALAIPIGAGQLVAAGGGNLIGNDGSTLIGNDGSTLVAAGGGNLIRFNGLIGNDGSTLTSQTAASLFSASGLQGLVAAGGGNLVAAGGGNLVGNDGASLIGLDGSTLRGVTIASLVGNDGASLVAAGGGNLISENGLGLVAAGGGNLLSDNGLGLVAAGGGNLVAAGGGNLMAAGGGNALSRDVSRAAALGANATFIVGGGGPLVAAGGGN